MNEVDSIRLERFRQLKKETKIHRLKKYRDILGGELWVFFPKFSETAQA